jgi:hypothetical protein
LGERDRLGRTRRRLADGIPIRVHPRNLRSKIQISAIPFVCFCERFPYAQTATMNPGPRIRKSRNQESADFNPSFHIPHSAFGRLPALSVPLSQFMSFGCPTSHFRLRLAQLTAERASAKVQA